MECAESCVELGQYQLYLRHTEDLHATPGIDYSEEGRMELSHDSLIFEDPELTSSF